MKSGFTAWLQTLGKTGPELIIFLAVLPLVWWAPYASFVNSTSTLRSLGQASALVGTILFCINFVLAARFRLIEHLFFGLNRAYVTHHLYGAAGFILLLLHPVFLTLSYLIISLESAVQFIIPTADTLPILFGESALAVLIVVLFLTLYVPLEYDFWKKTHTWIGIPLGIAILHAYFIDSTITQVPVLRMYILGFFIVAAGAYIWRLSLKLSTYGRCLYKVTSVNQRESITIVTLDPVAKKMKYLPGQFAYLVFEHLGIPKESHPFSITSDPADHHLTFAVKSVGDFTETLKLLEHGSTVWVEGPYGRFSWQLYNNKQQVWIAGGIGITPFLGMLSSFNRDLHCTVALFYCVRDHREAVFDRELAWCQEHFPSVTYIPWVSAEQGRLTGEKALSFVNDGRSREFFLCGPPPMMRTLSKQLVQAGVRRTRIHTEEFSLQ